MSVGKDVSSPKHYLEVLRIIASFFVIINHVINPPFYFSEISLEWFISVIFFFLSKIAVPIFLMISGSLLLNKVDGIQKYIERIFRCVCVIFIFTVIYYIYYYRLNEWTFLHFIKNLFGGVTIAYWYLYVYLGILIILPLLQRIVKVITNKRLGIILFTVLILLGFVPMLFQMFGKEIQSNGNPIYFICYVAIFFCGYYVEKNIFVSKKMAFIAAFLFFALLIIQVVLTERLFYLNCHNYMLLDNRILPTITLGAICFYICIKHIVLSSNINGLWSQFLFFLGGLTFGIYLLGDLFIDLFCPIIERYYGRVNTFILLFSFSIFIYLVCAIMTFFLKKMPILKKLL